MRPSGIPTLCIDYRYGFEPAFGYRSVVGPTLLGTFVVGQSSRRIGEGKKAIQYSIV